MRIRLPWLLLGVSLALNVFAIAGAVYSGGIAGDATSPEQRLETVVERLGLTADQRAQLVAIRERTIARRQEMREAAGRMADVIRAALEASPHDSAAFAARMQERDVRRRAFFEATVAELHAFLDELTPAQKATFLELTGERRFLRELLGRPRARKG